MVQKETAAKKSCPYLTPNLLNLKLSDFQYGKVKNAKSLTLRKNRKKVGISSFQRARKLEQFVLLQAQSGPPVLQPAGTG